MGLTRSSTLNKISLDALLPILYLHGVATGDFQEALTALLGKDAPNLSLLDDCATTCRLYRRRWPDGVKTRRAKKAQPLPCQQRSLSKKRVQKSHQGDDSERNKNAADFVAQAL
jgi:hypothetical protein